MNAIKTQVKVMAQAFCRLDKVKTPAHVEQAGVGYLTPEERWAEYRVGLTHSVVRRMLAGEAKAGMGFRRDVLLRAQARVERISRNQTLARIARQKANYPGGR